MAPSRDSRDLVCVKCGAWFARGAVTCPVDGTRLVKPETLLELIGEDEAGIGSRDGDELICAHCGARYPEGTRECPRDRTPLVMSETLVELARPARPLTSKAGASGQLICVKCRRRFDPGLRRCPEDGTPLVRHEITASDGVRLPVDPACRADRRGDDGAAPRGDSGEAPDLDMARTPVVIKGDPRRLAGGEEAARVLDSVQTLQGVEYKPGRASPGDSDCELTPVFEKIPAPASPDASGSPAATAAPGCRPKMGRSEDEITIPAARALTARQVAAVLHPEPAEGIIPGRLAPRLITIGVAAATLLLIVASAMWIVRLLSEEGGGDSRLVTTQDPRGAPDLATPRLVQNPPPATRDAAAMDSTGRLAGEQPGDVSLARVEIDRGPRRPARRVRRADPSPPPQKAATPPSSPGAKKGISPTLVKDPFSD